MLRALWISVVSCLIITTSISNSQRNEWNRRIADAEHTLALDCFYCAKDKVTEYLNKKEDEEQEEEEEKPEEAEKELDAILEEAKNYVW